MTKKNINWVVINLFFSFAFLCCKNNTQQEQSINTANLFSNDKKDSLLIFSQKHEEVSILSSDSAFNKSSLVAVCMPLAIDSPQQNNKTAFYLNIVKPLRILKGVYNSDQPLYFISNTLPIFVMHDSGWVVYLEPLLQKKLLAYNIHWQWLNNTPCNKTLPTNIVADKMPIKKEWHKKKYKRKLKKRNVKSSSLDWRIIR